MISDPKTAKWLIDSFHVLEIIESMTDKDMETKPSDVALQLYLDKLKDIQDEPKRKKFLATKQSRVSRMISRLKDLGLIKTIKHGEEMDGRYKFYQVTEKGRQLLDYPDAKNKLKEIAKKSSDKAKIDPEDYLKTIEREKHSDDIRTLQKRIKTELDQAFIKEVFPDELNYPFILKRLDEFPFEKDILYEDLSHHLGTFMDFSEFKRLLEEFKKKGKEYIGIESRLEETAQLELKKALELPLFINGVTEQGFTYDLTYWLLKAMELIYLNKYDLYRINYHGFKYEILRDENIESQNTLIKINGMIMIKHSRDEDSQNYLKRLERLLAEISDTEFAWNYLGLMSLDKELISIRTQITTYLDKEMKVRGYSGDCPFIKGSKNRSAQ